MERLIHVLLFSGLCLLIQSTSCEYVLIRVNKTWDEAQVYCRRNHIDLATVQNNNDWTNVQQAVQSPLPSLVWVGLYNDINSWRWSYQDENMTFTGWRYDQPNNIDGIQECGAMELGEWVDIVCSGMYPIFCYKENETGEGRFVLISNINLTWHAAQSYCRLHYTDLATVQSQTENGQLKQMMQGFWRVWIGLFRDSWKWSDGTNVSMSSIKWMSTTRDISGQNRPCGAGGPDGRIDDKDCSDALPFICKQRSVKQIVRLEVKSGLNLTELAGLEGILQWVKQKLEDHGIEKDIRLTWRLQADGHVFTPKHDDEVMILNQKQCSQFI